MDPVPEVFPLWVIALDYISGVVMWTLIGRTAMGFFLPEDLSFFFMRFLSVPPIHYFVFLLQLPRAFSCLLWFRFMSPCFFTCCGFTWCPGCWVTRWWGCYHFHWRAKLQGWYTESCPLSESCSRSRFFLSFPAKLHVLWFSERQSFQFLIILRVFN